MKATLYGEYSLRAPVLGAYLAAKERESIKLVTWARERARNKCTLDMLTTVVNKVDDLLTTHLQKISQHLFAFRRRPERSPNGEDFRNGEAVSTWVKISSKRSALSRPIVTAAGGEDPLTVAQRRFEELWGQPNNEEDDNEELNNEDWGYTPPPDSFFRHHDGGECQEDHHCLRLANIVGH